jgi:hypothetical protein
VFHGVRVVPPAAGRPPDEVGLRRVLAPLALGLATQPARRAFPLAREWLRGAVGHLPAVVATSGQPAVAPTVERLGVPMLRARPVITEESGPQPYRYDFATLEEYERAWRLWRAIVRDGRMTDDEMEESFAVALGIVDARSRDARWL